jgi:hypothetical protein
MSRGGPRPAACLLGCRDDAKRVARFDLHPGEAQALCALVKRSLFDCEQIDLLLRDDLSLTVALLALCEAGIPVKRRSEPGVT